MAPTLLPDGSGVAGTPLVMGTTSVPPTATHAVVLMQPTALRGTPGTSSTVPGTPLVMGTTKPSPEAEFDVRPTTKQVVALGQATPLSVAVPGIPGIGWTMLADAGAGPSAPVNGTTNTSSARTPGSERSGLMGDRIGLEG
jgi:hypothetical protein